MRLKRTFLHSLSSDSAMAYELYDLDDNPKPLNPNVVRGIRYALWALLGIVLVGAISILGIGIWTLEAEYGNKQVSELINAQLYQVDSYLMIIGGSAITLITIVGVLGVLKEYRCLLGLHLGLLAFMSVMLFVAGVLGYVLVSELEEKVREKMENAVVNHYGVDLDSRTNRIMTDAWDKVQQGFECCGVNGDENSLNSWYIYQRSEWYMRGESNGSRVPESCCQDNINIQQCTGYTNSTPGSPPRQKPPINDDPDARNYTLFTRGCFDVLDPYMHRTGITIGTTAIVVGLFMLVELVLSICLYRTLPEKT